MEVNAISITKFLLGYINLYIPYKITHKELKEMMPELKRCSFEEANNHREQILNGQIIYVKDGQNNVAPYLRPEIDYGNQPPIEIDMDYQKKQPTKRKRRKI